MVYGLWAYESLRCSPGRTCQVWQGRAWNSWATQLPNSLPLSWVIIITGWWLSPTPLKNMKVKWDDDIPNIWKNKKGSKPPARSMFSW